MTGEDIHKKRFLMFAAARLSGVALIMLGMAVAFTDLVREGGFRQLGGLLIAIGTIEMVVLPILLKRSWDRR
ncbi:MAG: hypothetical protein M3Q57_01635 [Pseudomonadota bacterium]|nr:hypothetical protein [Pseudomonadota bacterium]